MVSMDHQREASFRGPDLKLLIRDLRDRQGKKRAVVVRSWSTVKDVKDAIQQVLHVPPSSQRLFFGPLLTSRGELPNHRTLQDAGIYRSGETLLLDIKDSPVSDSSSLSPQFSLFYANDICISSSTCDLAPKRLRNMVDQARRGFAMGLKPEFVLDGSGGTYFLRDSRKGRIAVFKPADEEPYAENNPRGYLPQPGQLESLREGIVPGEACVREVAAFILDHGGVCGVPMTTLAEARHPTFSSNGARLKVAEGGAAVGSHSITPSSPVRSPLMKKAGSFQEFIHCECTMDDMSPSKISVEEVQKIAILDIRIMNADRNAANLLVRRRADNSLELVPIDHGFSLRTVCDVSWMDWCWLDWPQLKEPICEKLKKYIENLDIEADARLLQESLSLSEKAIDYMRASTALLKTGARAGLTLYDIACLCCRNDNLAEVPSMMEKLFTMASELAHVAIENERWHHTAASRALVQQLAHDESSLFLPRKRMPKAASSGSFLSLARQSSQMSHDLGGRGSPALAQSSASDTSSEDDDVVTEDDCDKWAAGVIAGVSVEQMAPLGRPMRTNSIASDDASSDSNLSSSPRGFWRIQPGTSPGTNCSEDGSICWSPATSLRGMADCPEPPETLAGAPVGRGPSVRFLESLPSNGPFIPPATVSVSKFKTGGDFETDFPIIQRVDSGMVRRNSYSALSEAFRRSSDNGAQQRQSNLSRSERDYTFRAYFHKFIDLVIERETTSAMVHASRRTSFD